MNPITLKLLRDLFKDTIRIIAVNSEKKTICVVFRNGSKQIVRCSPNDEFDPEIGVALAIARDMAGSKTQLRKLIAEKSKEVGKPKAKAADAQFTAQPPLPKPAGIARTKIEYSWFHDFLRGEGMTQSDAAEMCELSKSTISRVCCGVPVTKQVVDILAWCFGLTPEQAAMIPTTNNNRGGRHVRK